MSASNRPTELIKIAEVEVRTKMKRANIYRLIQLGQFPAPIHLGGARWRAEEIEEFIQRRTEERDRDRGGNNFVPRPVILFGYGSGAPSGPLFEQEPGITPSQPSSTVRILEPELCQALRMLKLDVPELYLDPAVWNVSLAVVKVELSPSRPATPGSKRKRR